MDKNIIEEQRQTLKVPKYVRTADGHIGAFCGVEFGYPLYRFEGGARHVDDWELEHGAETREELLNTD